jgi:hypothetical protein
MIEYLIYVANKNSKEREQKMEAFSESEFGLSLFIMSFMLSIFCIYLSWMCNTRLNTDVFLKIIYAFFAWFFGIFYLIFYFFVNYVGKGCHI